MKRITFLVLGVGILAIAERSAAQAGAGVKYGDKHAAYVDSIKRTPYTCVFPAWGKRIAKKGFDIPYPVGIMLNPYHASQKVNISDLKVGFNGGEAVPLDFIQFGEVKAHLQSITVRPDLWVLPFLDLYAIGGLSYAQTSVSVVSPMSFSTTANFSGNTFGLGTTLAGGYRGMLTIIDINHTWTHMGNISGSIEATMFTPRIGLNLLLKNHPNKSVAFWIGTSGFFVNRTTEGTINLGDLKSVNASKNDLQGIIDGTVAWYQQLSHAQQVVVKSIAQKLLDKLNGLNVDDATLSYSLKKQPVSNWSMCIGGQVQFSHRWQVRTEVGFFGGKQSLLLSGNYRFRW